MKATYKQILGKAEELSEELINKPCIDVKKVPTTGGVYLIRRDNNIIYVGKAKNLSRRINSDHISGENKNTTSTVRRKITKKLRIPHGKELRKWMSECSFSVIEVDDSDLRSLIESLTIYLLRKEGEPLLND